MVETPVVDAPGVGTPDKVPLNFTEIRARLKGAALPEVDAVVGIATGGVVPASLVAYELDRPLKLMRLNYRAPDNTPQRPKPELLAPFGLEPTLKRVLLVDDVSVSGKTLAEGKALLEGREVVTLVMKGRADITLFPQIKSCVLWPWRVPQEPGDQEAR